MKLITALAACLLAAGCQHTTQTVTTNAPLTGAAAGTMLSTFLPAETLRVLDVSDRPHIELAMGQAHNAYPGARIAWGNARTGNGGVIEPRSRVRTDDGRQCREYRSTVYLKEGPEVQAHTSGCQQPDGTWAGGPS